jgi:two-component system, cell cycle response regulator CpdR
MLKILIVDDEPLVTRFLRKVFLHAGYEVATADSAAAAMKLSESFKFDVMVSDVIMPKMNGHELARWMARNHPETQVVLMSGLDVACQKCAYSPRCKMLPKPFKPQDAVSLVASLAR